MLVKGATGVWDNVPTRISWIVTSDNKVLCNISRNWIVWVALFLVPYICHYDILNVSEPLMHESFNQFHFHIKCSIIQCTAACCVDSIVITIWPFVPGFVVNVPWVHWKITEHNRLDLYKIFAPRFYSKFCVISGYIIQCLFIFSLSFVSHKIDKNSNV